MSINNAEVGTEVNQKMVDYAQRGFRALGVARAAGADGEPRSDLHVLPVSLPSSTSFYLLLPFSTFSYDFPAFLHACLHPILFFAHPHGTKLRGAGIGKSAVAVKQKASLISVCFCTK